MSRASSAQDHDPGYADLWHALADTLGDWPAVSCGGVERTWQELDHRADRLAGYLAAGGLSPGDRVGIAMRNSVEHVEAFFALFKAGLTPVNLNVRYRSTEFQQVLADSGARGLVADASITHVIDAALSGSRVGAPRIAVPDGDRGDGDAVAPPPGFASYDDVLAGSESLPRRTGHGDEHIILYTGGTTGTPKGAVWSHRDTMGVAAGDYRRRGYEPPESLTEAVRIAREVAGWSPRPVVLPATPLMHGTGFYAMLGGLAVGGEVALLAGHSFSAAELWSVVERRRVTDLVITGDALANPMIEELCAARDAGRQYDLSSVVSIRSAGMRWSREVKLGLLEFVDAALYDVMASSEGGPYGVSVTRRGDDPTTARFVLPPGGRVLTADDRDVVPGSGEVGLLAAPGRMPSGYLGDPDKTAETFRMVDGVRYAMPGDRATVEADGTLTLLGRHSGVINSGGEKIDAEEVENVLAAHPGVVDAVVVGAPDQRWGEAVVAIVVAREGYSVTADCLLAYVRERLAGYKKPRHVLFVDELARTAVGKADRRWARQAAAEAVGSE